MGHPRLSLQVPAEHNIIISPTGSASESTLHGQLLLNSISQQCDVHITLVRIGRLKRGNETTNDTASKRLIGELGFLGSQKEQKRRQIDYKTAEKLSRCLLSPPQGVHRAKSSKCDFDLPIPSYLPSTTALPSVDISYAIFATCVLPNGKVLQKHQDLRIFRKNAEAIFLEPARKISFPETSFAVRTRFDSPELGSKTITIPTTLELNGLKLSMNSSMRPTETRWLVPREIRWEFEETAVIITGFPDATGGIPMSVAERSLNKRKLAAGKEKLKLKYPFTRPGNTPIRMISENTGIEVPLTIAVPKESSLGDSTALAVAGGHVIHTVLAHDTNLDPGLPSKRFAVYLEYKLHIWLRIGEDVFDEASGDLVNRKIDEMAYTVVCPLTSLHGVPTTQMDQDQEPAPQVPPSYDGIWEQSPPEYTTYS